MLNFVTAIFCTGFAVYATSRGGMNVFSAALTSLLIYLFVTFCLEAVFKAALKAIKVWLMLVGLLLMLGVDYIAKLFKKG